LQFYGDYGSKVSGRQWGVYKDTIKDISFEFKVATPALLAGIDITNIQDVLQLGNSFSGAGNYLAALQPDVLPKKILRPSLANSFWRAANDDQKKLTTEIRKAYLRRKLATRIKRKNPAVTP